MDEEQNVLYCPKCPFELPYGTACKPTCPDCGHCLRLWDISDGTLPHELEPRYWYEDVTFEELEAIEIEGEM